ncbi:MAG: ribosomal-processing cysteine protease Prp [Clostridiales bacterium]|jgi:uncharacterized protein YsxB (DUF464 family)|nr:ribosomal-processing cysteine protease Prp [Clostridiales bacterium]
MIKATVFRNKNGEICAFKVKNHGKSIVCAAVSVLTVNAVNSVEKFTGEEAKCSYKEEGGYINFEMPRIMRGFSNEKTSLLMDSFYLGLTGVARDNPESIEIIVKEVL